MMKAHWKSWLVFALLLGTTAYCVAEQVMVMTTYPSPLGVYQTLSTTGNTYLATQGGNVGIGATSAGSKLDVAGTAQLRGAAGGTGLVVDASGNVGIGTPTPAYKLHANDAGGGTVALTAHSGTVIAKLSSTGTGGTPGAAVGTDSNHPFNLLTNGAARVYLDATGSVGIGKTPSFSPLSTLEIQARTLPLGFTGPTFPLMIYNQSNTGVAEIDENGTIATRGFVRVGSSVSQTGVFLKPGTDPWPLEVGRNVGGGAPKVLVGASDPLDPAQTRAGWIEAVQGLVVPPWTGPAPLILQRDGGNVGINFFGLPGNPPPRRPLDVWGEIVAVNRVTLARDTGTATSTWAIDNSSTVPGSDVFRIFRQDNIDVAGQEYLKIFSAVPVLFPGGGVQIAGNLAIGDNVDVYRLRVNGNTYINGSLELVGGTIIPADIAENMDCPDCEAGDVVVVDLEHDHQLTRSTAAYDPTFAGVISTKPALNIGGNRGESARPLALAGQVPCKVSTENGPIKRGDLLVTSSKSGYAMRADSESIKPGTLIGKALEPLAEGEGTILVLITGG